MAKSKWGAKLKKGKAQWKKSEERYQEMFAGSDLPEDVYVSKLQECGFVESGNAVSIKRSFVVIEGEHKGVVVSDRLNLFHDVGAAFVRKWLRIMDVEDVSELDIEDLEDVLAEFNDEVPVCKVRIKQGDFTNVEVLSLLDDDEGSEDSGGDDDDGDDGDDGDDEGIDLDDLDEDELREVIKDQEIDPIDDLGFKNKAKYKKADADALRKALEEHLSEESADDDGDDGDDGDDELLEEAKLFCGTQDIDLDDDDDLDNIKEKIEENAPYKEKDLDEDEKELLEKLELTKLIKKSKAKGKDKKSGKDKKKKDKKNKK